MTTPSLLQRAMACLKGLSTGDAVGKQTETLSREAISQWYPAGVTGFHGEPGTVITRYVGKRYEWRVGETTDDTEQTIAVARTLLEDGAISHSRIGQALMKCRKSNHPDVSLGRFQQRGDPDFLSSAGDGCGAAMRIAPIGIACRPDNTSLLVHAAFNASVSTHGGQFGICAAASVAGALSAAIEGESSDAVLRVAIDVARYAERLRPPSAVGNMAAAVQRMHDELSAAQENLPARLRNGDCFPDRPAVIVPLAISLALVTKSSRETILLAANAGGDTDSVASIGGALAGAMHPHTVDEEWYRIVEQVNRHGLDELATELIGMRR